MRSDSPDHPESCDHLEFRAESAGLAEVDATGKELRVRAASPRLIRSRTWHADLPPAPYRRSSHQAEPRPKFDSSQGTKPLMSTKLPSYPPAATRTPE